MKHASLVLGIMLASCVSAPPLNPPKPPPEVPAAVFGRLRVEPNWMHVGIWFDVMDCLDMQRTSAADPRTFSWSLADSIIIEGAFLAYGMTEMDARGRPEAIVIERGFWWNPAVISHEVLHALVRDPMHATPVWTTCQLPSPITLPLRLVGGAS